MLTNHRLTIWHYLALIALIYLAYFFGLSTYPLSNNNEGLYAEVAREMLQTGDFIIPHLNFVPYIEKPPLLYWLVALNYQIFGVSTFAARLVPAVCGMLTSLSLLWFGHRIGRAREGWLAAVMLTTCIGFIVIARVVFFDMLLTACLTFTLLLFYLWHRTTHKKYLHLAYAALALAVLTKGMLALVLIPLICFAFLIICKQARKATSLLNPTGILIFAAIVLPWHIIASNVYPEFAWDYFINEQLLRFLNERQPHDYYSGPFYYYLPRIILYLFPWCFLLPLFIKRKKMEENSQDNNLSALLWLWVIIPLVFFSASCAKANYYMVISVPALALLLASKLFEQLTKRKLAIFVFTFVGLALALLAGLIYQHQARLSFDQFSVGLTSLLSVWLYALWAYLLVFITLSIYFWRRTRRENNSNLLQFQINNQHNSRGTILFLGVAGFTCLLLSLANKVMPTISDQLNELTIANYILQQDQSTPVYLYRNYAKQSTLLFYLQKRISIIELKDADLMYGANTSEAEGWFISMDAFNKTAKRNACYVAVQKDDINDFLAKTQKVKFCQVAESGKNVLFSNKNRACNYRQ